jgi:hypothetical protein
VDLLDQPAHRPYHHSAGGITESFGSDTRLDVIGVALVTGVAFSVVWGLMGGNRAGWTAPEVIAALAAGVVLSVAFIAWERRAREPMVPMQFFSSRAFSSGIAASFLLYASLYSAVFLHLADIR